VSEPVAFIIRTPSVDAARISEQASLQPDPCHEYSLLPCVRSFLTQLIRQRGNRNNRMYAIAWDLARQGASEAEVLEVLMEFYDRCYQVKGGTSRREHEAEARSRARVARGSKFNCREKPEVFSSHCGKDGCRFWRHWGRRQDLAGFPVNDPRLHELGSSAVSVYLVHFQAASKAGQNGTDFYYLPAWMEYLGKCSPNTSRAARKKLVEAGFLRPVSTSHVPRWVLAANGHTHRRSIPQYYLWMLIPPLPPVGGADVSLESLQAESDPPPEEPSQ
jgi:hypothetical protein